MSINKIFVPEKKVLRQFLEQNGSELFYKRYVKSADALIGSSKSIDYIEEFKNKYRNESDSVFFKLG
jgi:hypothetical protein